MIPTPLRVLLGSACSLAVLAGCSGGQTPAAPEVTTSTVSAGSTFDTAGSFATPTDSPTPDTPVGFTAVPASDANDQPTQFFVKVGKPTVAVPFHDGSEADLLVGFPVTIEAATGNSAIRNDQFEIAPTPGGAGELGNRTSYATDAGITEEAKVAIKVACGKLPMFDTAAKQAGADVANGGYTIPATVTDFTGCMTFDYTPAMHPTKLLFSSASPSYGPPTSPATGTELWTGTMPAQTGAAPQPTVLARFAGSSSQLLTVPPSALGGKTVKICWNMQGSGNHIIQTETETSGSNLNILTNTLGSPDVQCHGYTQLDNYIQVIAEDDWSITITNF